MTSGAIGGTRRAALLGAVAATTVGPTARAAASPARFAFVGTYTPNGGGIHGYRFDPADGRLTPIGVTDGIENPSWLCVDPTRRRLFAVSEIGDQGKGVFGLAVSYAIGPDGVLTRLGAASTAGAGPAHASLHPSGRFLLVANYLGGSVAVLPVGDDGVLKPASDVQVIAPEPRPAPANPPAGAPASGNFAVSDHSRPHMHMVASDRDGRFVLAADAGSDRLYAWRFDAGSGRLTPAATPWTPVAPGSAPRHFCFHPNGRLVYVLREHDSRIGCYHYDPRTGGLTAFDEVATLPAGFAGGSLGSEIALSADGRRLYAANRLRNTITVFEVSRSGALSRIGETWTQGDYPRGFGLAPSGGWLVVCNQRSDSLSTFRVGAAGTRLDFDGRFTPVGSPASIVFIA